MAQRFTQNKVLGVTLGERSLVAAEAVRGGGADPGGVGAVVTLAATFEYPAGTSLDTPEPLGQALSAFLKDNGFTARHAVVGLPARWILSKPKDVPPAAPDVVAEALRLQVEGEFSQELKDLVFDYAGQTSETDQSTVLLMAVQGKQLDKAKAVIAAAGLTPAAAVPAALVLGAATATAGGRHRSALVVTAGCAGVELVAHDGSRPQVLRHLGPTTAPPAMLAGELRRAAMGLTTVAPAANGNGHANGHAAATPLVLWDAAALGDPARRVLADAASARIESGDLAGLGVDDRLSAGGRAVASAAALALAPYSPQGLPVDFFRSKLAEPKKPRIPRKVAIGIGVGVVVVGLLAFGVWDILSKQSHLADLQAQTEKAKPDVAAAQAVIKRYDAAAKWGQDQPQYLAAFRDLILTMPQDERGSVYLTDFTLSADFRGTCTVRSSSQAYVQFQMLPQMRAKNSRFKNVVEKLSTQRQQGNTEYVYRITFQYQPMTVPATQPAAAPAKK